VNWGTDNKSLNNLKGKLNTNCSSVNEKKAPVAGVTSP
jgi:hypothetical protein